MDRGVQHPKPGEEAAEPPLNLTETVAQATHRLTEAAKAADLRGDEEGRLRAEAQLKKLKDDADGTQ